MSSNRLKLNPLKTELIWLHSSRRNPTFLREDIVLLGSPITPVNVDRNLGVILDENMTMSEHIARVCRNCYYQLRQIRKIKRSLTASSKTLLVLASVHSRLYYCKSVLNSLPWSRLQLLQSVLNSAARLFRGLKRFDHISPVLIDLHWLPYPQRVIYKVCMLMFKCLKGLAPTYLVAFCTKGSAVCGRSALRSAVRGDLLVPGHRTDWGLEPLPLLVPKLMLEWVACWIEGSVSWSWDFCETLKDALVQSWFFSDGARTFEFV